MYDVCTDYLEIIAGTNNRYAKAYVEASKNIEASNDRSKRYIENFIKSIEAINKKAGSDKRITSSKGNIKSFQGYENITDALAFLSKNGASIPGLKSLSSMKNSLEKLQPLYTEAYEKNIQIIMIEYDTTVYMLVTGLALLIATHVDVSQNNGKSNVVINTKNGNSNRVIIKTCDQLAKELSAAAHKSYLEGLIASSEVNVNESVSSIVGDTLTLIDNFSVHVNQIKYAGKNILATIKRTLFGIVPLIRCGLYLKYKKKADTIVALEQQMNFIQQNIDKLEKRTNIDQTKKEEIIKKQQAYIEAYRKKAEKLKAQLTETEKEASTELAKEDPKMGDTSNTSDNPHEGPTDDGDFILEGSSIRHSFNRIDDERRGMISKRHLRTNRFSFAHKPNISPKDKALADKALAEIKKATTRDSIRLKLGNRKDNDDISMLVKSKLGGTPYWPADMKWPKYKDENMFLFAQLNFDEIPHIDGYPKSGIVQIFTVDDQWYESTSHDKRYKIIYHEKPDVKARQIESIPKSTCIDFKDDFPFTGVYYIDKFIKESISINICNERALEEIAMPIINKYFKSNWKTIWSINGDLGDYFIDALVDEDHRDHRIGGWPSFTQYDMMDDKYNTLLLQIDSDDPKDIIWGDCGISNVFINDKSLRRKDFSDVLCTWDCY